MRVLVTSGGNLGAWQIRGAQLGAAIGARVCQNASAHDIEASDVIIAVKRVRPPLSNLIRMSGRLVIWDCVDFYRQPNNLTREQLIAECRARAAEIGATALIGATRRMAEDIGTPYFLPHHGWDRGQAEVRQCVTTVGYEGSPRYIESLRPAIEAECAARGWRFVVNPQNYADLDIVVSMRGSEWTNYASRNWKSAVKLSNAQIAGIPFIGNRERGCIEQASGFELWADNVAELRVALNRLESQQVRRAAQEAMLRRAPRLDQVAAAYLSIIRSVA